MRGYGFPLQLPESQWQTLLNVDPSLYPLRITDAALTLAPSLFSNSQTFYTHVLTTSYTLTQSSSAVNSQTFYAHDVSQGLTLSQSARFDNSQSFYAHALGLNLLQGSAASNAQSFYAHALDLGLTQATTASNSQSFYSHTLTTVVTLAQAATASSSQSFYAHTLTPGAVTLTPALFANDQAFFVHAIELNLLAGRFDNVNDLGYQHSLAQDVTITQDARVENVQPFMAHGIALEGAESPAQISYGFFEAFDRQLEDRKAQLLEEQEAKQAALEAASEDSIQGEIAQILHEQIAVQEEQDALERLRQLVISTTDTGIVPQRVKLAFERAQAEQTFSRLQALQREFERMQQEEEEDTALIMLLQ